MGKLLKVVGWILGIFIVLVVAAVLILPQVVDPNDYKEQIVDKVREQTGRELQIDGRITLSVFPWLGVETGAIRLGNAKGFAAEDFAAVKAVAVRVKLMPLISRQLEADTVALKGLRLNLERDKNGHSNWDDLAGKSVSKEEKQAQESAGEGGGLDSLSIGGIDISDAEILWDDQSAGQKIKIEQLQLQSGAVSAGRPVDLKLSMQVRSSQPEVDAGLDLQTVVALDEAAGVVDLKDLVAKLAASGKTLPGGKLDAVLQANVSAALDGSTLAIEGLRVSAADLSLNGALQGRDLASQPAFSGNLALAEFNLRKWMSDMGMALPPMADPKALTRVGAKLNLAAEGATTRIDGLTARLDDTQINGSASVQGSAIGFNLSLDAIDADRYMPPQEAASKPSSDASKPVQTADAGKEAPLYPVETLRALNLDGVLSIGKLTISKLLAEQLQLTLKAKDGRLSLKQQVKKFYQGGYQGETNIDVSGNNPRTRVKAAATGIQVGPLLKDLSGQERLLGKGRFSASLDTRGNSIDAVKKALGGKLDFRFENGAVKGFNLAQTIRDTKARLSGKTVAAGSGSAQTDFSELSGSGTIRKGTLTNRDLLAKSPFLRVDGAGWVNLVAENLDYKVRTVVVKSAKGQGGEGLEDLQGVTIPVHLTGPYAAPKVSVDWERALLESQKGRVEEKVKEKIQEKLGDKLEQKLPAGLKDKLKGLF